MSVLNKRQIIILAALALPVLGLTVLSFMGPDKPKPAPKAPPPKVAGTEGKATPKPPAATPPVTKPADSRPANRPARRVVLPTLQEMRDNINSRWKEAESITEEKYDALYRKDRRLPPTLALYRERILSRKEQLDKMTQEEFEEEQRMRIEHLRQRGIVPMPRPPGSSASPVDLLKSQIPVPDGNKNASQPAAVR